MEGREDKNKVYFSLTKAAKSIGILPSRNPKWDWWKQHWSERMLDFIEQHFNLMISC